MATVATAKSTYFILTHLSLASAAIVFAENPEARGLCHPESGCTNTIRSVLTQTPQSTGYPFITICVVLFVLLIAPHPENKLHIGSSFNKRFQLSNSSHCHIWYMSHYGTVMFFFHERMYHYVVQFLSVN